MNKNKFFVPFQDEPKIEPKEWSEFEDILEYDSKIDNIIYTGEKKNIQVAIDSYKDQTLIYNILDKYIGIGTNPETLANIPELNKREGQYINVADLPKNIHELKKLSELAQKQIKNLQQQQEENKNVNSNPEVETLPKNETPIQTTKTTEQTIKENQ